MTQNRIDAVISALNGFEPSRNDVDNVQWLYETFKDFRLLPGRESVAPAIFALLERFPEADLGSPGPLVHELEAMSEYQPLLRASLRRQPTDLTVWMVNRILNANPPADERSMWLSELQSAGEHPKSPESTRESVAEFLEHQNA